MPRKLTILGVLAALVLGLVGLSQSASATPAQSFCTGNISGPCTGGATPVNWDICYGGSAPVGPGLTGCGAGSSDTYAGPVSTNVTTYQTIEVPRGSRLTLPITYTPGDWTYTAVAAGATTGNVTAITDVGCNGAVDVLSDVQGGTPLGDTSDWPGNGWGSFPFIRQNIPPVDPDGTTGSNNAYIDAIKPMPASFSDTIIDRSNLYTIWLGGTVGFDLSPKPPDVPPNDPNRGTPLVNLITTSPYKAGLTAGVALLGGSPNPPTADYLCLDSAQNSVAKYDNLITPAAPGDYVRWTAFQSAADEIDGTVTRIVDTQCVHVGPTNIAPVCDLTDADGDLLPAAVEAAFGTLSTVGNADTDGDGANDFTEMFQFSDPGTGVLAHPTDTDNDGSLDVQDNLSGMNCYSGSPTGTACNVANLGDTTADDNCPTDANASQANTDSDVDFTNTPNVPNGGIYQGDVTNSHQDSQGDACDTDIDNDGLGNVVETTGFQHPNVAPGAGGGPVAGTLWCLALNVATPTGGSTTVTTSPTNPDDDSDGGLDGRECLFGSDPKSAGATSCQPTCSGVNRFPTLGSDTDGDLLAPTAAETFFRTQGIGLPGGPVLDDIEQLGSYGTHVAVCTTDPDGVPNGCDNTVGPNDPDSDGDLINDGIEVKFYATSPGNFDTDGDGCSDGREDADLNGDHKVASPDSLGVAQHTTTGSLAPGKVGVPLPLGSPAGPYLTSGVRRTNLAGYDVNKDGKIDSGDSLLVSKLTGNCAFGTGAQTGKTITNSSKSP